MRDCHERQNRTATVSVERDMRCYAPIKLVDTQSLAECHRGDYMTFRECRISGRQEKSLLGVVLGITLTTDP